MTIRLACASTFTALGLACSSTSFARAAAYAPVPVIYAPPLADPVPAVLTVTAGVAASPVEPLPLSLSLSLPPSLPMITNVVVPAPTNYAAAPASVIAYAQALIAVPRPPVAFASCEFAAGEAATGARR